MRKYMYICRNWRLSASPFSCEGGKHAHSDHTTWGRGEQAQIRGDQRTYAQDMMSPMSSMPSGVSIGFPCVGESMLAARGACAAPAQLREAGAAARGGQRQATGAEADQPAHAASSIRKSERCPIRIPRARARHRETWADARCLGFLSLALSLLSLLLAGETIPPSRVPSLPLGRPALRRPPW